jgi:ribulose-phosphate 3-epimerase
MKKTIISPSLLSANFMQLEKELSKFEKAKDLWFHLDIMDGHFVPNLTFGHPILKQIAKTTKQPLDAHFMVSNPEFYVETLKDVPLHNFTFHYEATKHHDRLIQNAKQYFPSVGISFNPGTSIESLSSYLLEKLDLVLIMSVNPGFGGQKFIPGALEKIDYLDSLRKKRGFKFQIQVDGGVDSSNSADLIGRGVDNLVAGSYIFNTPNGDYLERVESLRTGTAKAKARAKRK